jgi:nucleotide-binding universal stress UspA family protein
MKDTHERGLEGVMKILLATDGSSFSEAAVKTAAKLVHAQDSEVLVLQVVEPLMYFVPPQMAPGYAPEQAERQRELYDLAKKTTALSAEKLRTAGFKADSRVVESDIRNGILDTAAEWKPDLIVMGSHGRKGVKRFLLGSVAEMVARHAPCSVLIVRSPDAARAETLAA